MDPTENGLQSVGSAAATIGGFLRFGRPTALPESELFTESGNMQVSSVGGGGDDMVRLSEQRHPLPPVDNGVPEAGWQPTDENEERPGVLGAWRQEALMHSETAGEGPTSWHGDGIRPAWEPRDPAWRRYEHEVLHPGGREAGWQQPQQLMECPEVDPGWRLPNIPRRGQDAGWRHTEYFRHPAGVGEGWRQQPLMPPNWQESCRLTHDLLRLKDRYIREECGSRDGNSGLSRESSRDDINSICEQQFEYEERFRVDRRKLELMMIGSGGAAEFGEAAAEFFARIGNETGTCVIWPSRLKIGAKSKKDPHIRVGGQEEGVKRARNLITEVLDTRTNSRVTMKMDVSYTDHSHIIGKGGNTIRRVMAETNCHIHFPDSNRSNPNEKSNQVSIAGEMGGVERARARVRELTPLLFQFDLAIVPSFQAAPDPNNHYMRAIQDQYNVQISFRQKQKNFHTTTCVVKGCEWEGSRVKEATLLLMDHMCHNMAHNTPVIMTMEISPQHHAIVIGKNSVNLKVIMQRTNTTIIFPDAGDPNIPPIKKGSVTISGAIHNVYLARQLLLGSLPIVMMFDLPEGIDVEESLIQKLQEENEVTISIKPKARQANKSVIIKTQERNVGGMYVARHRLLELDDEVVRAEVPETYKVPLVGSSSTFHMASLPANRGPYHLAHHQLLLQQGGCASPLSPTGSLPPSSMPTAVYGSGRFATPMTPTGPAGMGSPWQLSTSAHMMPPPPNPPNTPVNGDVAAASRLPLNHHFLQDYALMVLNNMKKQQHNLEHQQHHSKEAVQQWSSPPHQQSLTSHMAPSSSGLGSSVHSSPILSPRNSSPVTAAGNLTNNLHKMDLSVSSGIVADQNSSNVTDISAILSELSVGDRRAPGCEKKVVEIAADYEQKRLLATKAIQQKPAGEERTPNSVWSGLGFSSSMPAAVIREKIAEQNRARQAREIASNSDWFGQSTTLDSLMQQQQQQQQQQQKARMEGREDLPHLLTNQGLAKYADIFLRHEIDLPTFATLTDNELKEIGIPTFGARKKLLMLASKISCSKWQQ